LRFLDGIEKVEHVPFLTGDQFWTRFNRPIDMKKLQDVITKHDYQLIRFGRFPSKLPRKLTEVLWDGVTHVIVKKTGGWGKLTSSLGFEPDGIAKIVMDLHGPYSIFIAMNEDGVHVLYDYLGVKYVPPAPPTPKAIAPSNPPAPTAKPPIPPQPAAQPSIAPTSKPATVQPLTQEKKSTAP
jgi:hypothetical protein